MDASDVSSANSTLDLVPSPASGGEQDQRITIPISKGRPDNSDKPSESMATSYPSTRDTRGAIPTTTSVIDGINIIISANVSPVFRGEQDQCISIYARIIFSGVDRLLV